VKHFAELAATTIGVKANVALALARGFPLQNDPNSATRRTGRNDCNRDAHAGFAAAHG